MPARIAFSANGGTERVSLSPGDKPQAEFVDKGKAVVYAYCNLHGLWKAEMRDELKVRSYERKLFKFIRPLFIIHSSSCNSQI